MTKEEAYDAEIYPLMARIIEVCSRERIAMLADFRLGEALACTSALLNPEYDPSEAQLRALGILTSTEPEVFGITIS